MSTLDVLTMRTARLARTVLTASAVASAVLLATLLPTESPDPFSCWFDPTVPAWVTDAGDGVCHVGPHAVELTGEYV